MKNLDNKGLTITELIVSLVLVSIIIVIILQLLVDIRYEDALTKKRTSNLLTQSLLIKDIQDDLLAESLKEIYIFNKNIYFAYDSKEIELVVNDNYIIYDGERYVFSDNVKIDKDNITIDEKEYIDNTSILIQIPVNDNNFSYDIEIFHIDDDVNPYPKLFDLILDQGGGTDAIEAKGNPNMTIVPTTATSGLYATADEYGTSYYYRGEKNALANNVIYAGYQWKAVRINGDGSIRLIYNGTCPNNSCTINSTGSGTNIGTAAWNTPTRDDNKYLGFMYGGANGVASTSKEQAQKNETDSNAKKILEEWYESNIKNIRYERYIADNIFCNDRTIHVGIGFGSWQSGSTQYKTQGRLYINRDNPKPTLKCEQKNDRFTVSDIATGNGSLTYPIGLITGDEVQYAGIAFNFYNTSQYLYTGQAYWTMSPLYFDSSGTHVLHVRVEGGLYNNYSTSSLGFRPVINLTSKTAVLSGNGTTSSPYIISLYKNK